EESKTVDGTKTLKCKEMENYCPEVTQLPITPLKAADASTKIPRNLGASLLVRDYCATGYTAGNPAGDTLLCAADGYTRGKWQVSSTLGSFRHGAAYQCSKIAHWCPSVEDAHKNVVKSGPVATTGV
ncbi:unnamed protein product, partial [Amoebophrya sp. A25]